MDTLKQNYRHECVKCDFTKYKNKNKTIYIILSNYTKKINLASFDCNKNSISKNNIIISNSVKYISGLILKYVDINFEITNNLKCYIKHENYNTIFEHDLLKLQKKIYYGNATNIIFHHSMQWIKTTKQFKNLFFVENIHNFEIDNVYKQNQYTYNNKKFIIFKNFKKIILKSSYGTTNVVALRNIYNLYINNLYINNLYQHTFNILHKNNIFIIQIYYVTRIMYINKLLTNHTLLITFFPAFNCNKPKYNLMYITKLYISISNKLKNYIALKTVPNVICNNI